MITEIAKNLYSNIYKRMLQGLDLESISKVTGCDKSYILKVFKSEDFHKIANILGVYYQIYTVKNPSTMKDLLDGVLLSYLDDEDFFTDPDDYVRDFYYVNNQWVKKDKNGCIVETLEQLPLPEHYDEEWFKILRTRHQLMIYEQCV